MLKRVLPVDLLELEIAFETYGYEISYYLDLQTGEVEATTDEERSYLEKLFEELPEDTDFEALDWPKVCKEHGWPEWMASTLQVACRVEIGYGTRYFRVPRDESDDAYSDMEDFIATLKNPRLQDRLNDALRGKGAFRRFRDVLAEHEDEGERWFAFKRECLRRRILQWLDEEGIQAVPRPGS